MLNAILHLIKHTLVFVVNNSTTLVSHTRPNESRPNMGDLLCFKFFSRSFFHICFLYLCAPMPLKHLAGSALCGNIRKSGCYIQLSHNLLVIHPTTNYTSASIIVGPFQVSYTYSIQYYSIPFHSVPFLPFQFSFFKRQRGFCYKSSCLKAAML